MTRRPSPMNRSLRSRRGSSSILVVLMAVLLILFGVLSLVTAWSGLKLATLRADRSIRYYRVESQAERLLLDLEALVLEEAALDPERTPEERDRAILGRIRSLVGRDRIDRENLETEGILSLEIRVGEPSEQQILLGLRIEAGTETGSPLHVVSFRQYQEPFEYPDDPGNVWEG